SRRAATSTSPRPPPAEPPETTEPTADPPEGGAISSGPGSGSARRACGARDLLPARSPPPREQRMQGQGGGEGGEGVDGEDVAVVEVEDGHRADEQAHGDDPGEQGGTAAQDGAGRARQEEGGQQGAAQVGGVLVGDEE